MTDARPVPVVSVIVVSFNTRELTLAALRSLREESPGLAYELLVVDNDSSDGSADAIEAALRDWPDTHFIRSERNLGFAAANNLAAQRARGEFLLLLNPDTVVLDRAVIRLLDSARTHPAAGIWGGRTLFGDRTLNLASCWARSTPWSMFCIAVGLARAFPRTSLFNPEAMGGWDRSSPREVDIVSGCFFLIRRSFWTDLGGFDPAFFMYGEEADLCLRARRIGARPRIEPMATIIHYGGASERARADKMIRLFRAKRLLFERHMGLFASWWCKRMLDAWALSRLCAAAVSRLLGRGRATWDTWRKVQAERRQWASSDSGP